jgi:hypothetical protein
MADTKNHPAGFPTTPSDVIGAVQRGLYELHSYLAQPVANIDIQAALRHMDEMALRLSYLTAPPANASGKQDEVRAH